MTVHAHNVLYIILLTDALVLTHFCQVTVRFRGQCWSYSISWMVLNLQKTSKLLWLQTGLTFWIRHFSGLAELTEKLSFRPQMRRLEHFDIYKWKWSSQLWSNLSSYKLGREKKFWSHWSLWIFLGFTLLHNCENHFYLYSLSTVHSYDHIHIMSFLIYVVSMLSMC